MLNNIDEKIIESIHRRIEKLEIAGLTNPDADYLKRIDKNKRRREFRNTKRYSHWANICTTAKASDNKESEKEAKLRVIINSMIATMIMEYKNYPKIYRETLGKLLTDKLAELQAMSGKVGRMAKKTTPFRDIAILIENVADAIFTSYHIGILSDSQMKNWITTISKARTIIKQWISICKENKSMDSDLEE